MGQKHIVATVAVAAGLAGSGFLFSQAWSNPAPTPPPSTVSSAGTDGAAGRAADKAALVMMCEAGQHDAAANATYHATVAAHPDLGADIGPDCRLITVVSP